MRPAQLPSVQNVTFGCDAGHWHINYI